ncbi:hypothetical protein MN116_008302 [Schistosoma mekongi]|uniref:Sm domain-containing protein n=1 Tax=Schistosoma mekongi TaxID=38744 RepID=A0AAE1Z5T5_SCHME|nr:hypothetical protein MN116_008302 [Schistosoma mekongi]
MADSSSSVSICENSLSDTNNSQLGAKSRRSRSLLKYWDSFDPTRIHYGRGSQLRKQRLYSPMASLWKAMHNQSQVMVMTRGLREPRASLIGNLVAFDRYWNLVLKNVTEYSVNLPKSALRGYGKPGRSKKRREQRLKSSQRNGDEITSQLKKGSNFCSDPSNKIDIQRKDVLSTQPSEIGQLFLVQYDNCLKDEIMEKNNETNVVKPIRLLGKSPPSDDADDNQPTTKCNYRVNKSTLANIHDQLGENNNLSNWTPSMVHLNERNMSELSDISLWYSLKAHRNPLTEKQHNQSDTDVSNDKTTTTNLFSDDNEQLFIRGANIILVRIISEK